MLVWLPFLLRLENFLGIPLRNNGLQTVVSNYDGPLYIVVAKTLYSPSTIKENFSFPLPIEYYSAHFPLFPLLIRLVSNFMYAPYAMLLITIISAFLAHYFFFKLAHLYLDEKKSLILTTIFSIFPARWLIVRSVGSPEPLFVAFILASVYYFKNKKYLLSGIFGAGSQLTKSPGILLFVAFLIVWGIELLQKLSTVNQNFKYKLSLKVLPIFLIPGALLSVFYLYKVTFGDFAVYFKSGDNIHLFFPPFQIFNYASPWVGTFWLEEIIFIYAFCLLGVIYLIKERDLVLGTFAAVFLSSLIFVSHRDLIRYALPVVPFILISFRKFLISKEFRIVLLFLIVPIYLFSLGFISQNVMPIPNWSPLL
ncbi:hypothetical protein A2961_00330 [Candidatus Woesebacteria bacterium RIFCSPLOWO2_01_FULL_39_21]|uniref:Glycosyltransferase RgtA/B/C/D-like domain-containing protein n=1 Tax=Candidatus Woesebacteria bacterium RIFCSPLOWO2_01_FULL_39_21 TaxID=1802519 RepID=A0A1F8BHU5_9BACT|nr:MAG: hypothetical protein A2691_03800 [Candidatus Woesebacteria bacterium RIFCSPHIGHO2_01_FULL_39_23]OGM63627.1 MAG: hypothetical protein A2961_00330 [Candidatus Woesebacteria bacterium RIFCSPLOWO2_01_FULL_39_21]